LVAANVGDSSTGQAIAYFLKVCKEISNEFVDKNRRDAPARLPWGIPWIAKNHPNDLAIRVLLNAGWLIDDFEPKHNSSQPYQHPTKRGKREELKRLQEFISKRFPPGNNPTDWYVLWLTATAWGMAQRYALKTIQGIHSGSVTARNRQMQTELQDPFKEFLDETNVWDQHSQRPQPRFVGFLTNWFLT